MEDKTSTTQITHRVSLQPPSQQSDQPSSPLERLDPQRLREQAVASQLGSHSFQGGHWSPASTTMNVNSPNRTPGSVQSPMAGSIQQGHHSSGSVDSLHHFTNQQQFFPANEVNYMHQQQDKGARTPNIQNPSPSRHLNPAHMIPASPQSMSSQSPFVARAQNPNTGNPNVQYIQQPGQQYHAMVVNSQQMYATTPQTPGTPTGNPQRIAYQIQPGNTQFAYATTQPIQQQQSGGQQQPQQCITVQGYQMVQQQQFPNSTRVAVQPVHRVVHRVPTGYNQANMVYANVTGANSAPQRGQVRPIYAHVITTQSQPTAGQVQQVIQQQQQGGPHTPRTPQSAHISTPTTPVIGNPSQGNFYTVQSYPANYQGNGQPANFVQKPTIIRPFTVNTAPGQQAPESSHYQVLQQAPNQAGARQVVPAGQLQANQTMTVGQFASHQRNSQVGMMSPAINQGISMTQQQQQHMGRQQQLQLRAVAPSTPQIRAPKFLFDVSSRVPADICLSGCYFLLAENSTGVDVRSIIAMVRYYGGEIELMNNRCWSDRATHIICEYITSAPNQLIDRTDKRVCTLQWLNDIIERKRVEPPFKVCHLPGTLNRSMSLADKVISVTGFTDKEIVSLKWMIQLTGAKFCPYLTKNTSFLVAKSMSCAKVDKVSQVCQANNTPIVNINWICELYMGSPLPLSNIRDARYSPGTPSVLEIGAQHVFATNEQCARMMSAWQYPFAITDEHLMRGAENKRLILADDSICVSVKYGNLFETGPIPTQEQVNSAVKVLEKENVRPDVKIAFSCFPKKDVDVLSRKVKTLGVEVVDQVEKANFIVTPQNFTRTTNILKAISSGKDLISPLWIINSFARLELLPTADYFLHDTKSEQTFIYNLRHAVLSNRCQPIFRNTWFYVSPSVKPSRAELSEIIKCAGGNVEDTRPTRAIVLRFIEEERPYIIIASPCDLPFFQSLTDCVVPIFSEEFVYCAIMRYKIDTSSWFNVNLHTPPRGILVRPTIAPLLRQPLIAAAIR